MEKLTDEMAVDAVGLNSSEASKALQYEEVSKHRNYIKLIR